MFGWSDFDTWVLTALFAMVLLTFVQNPGADFASQPVVVAAASLITIPIGIASALASTGGLATLLLPLFFLLLVFYINVIRDWLGTGVLYFVLFAAALVMLSIY